MITTDIRRLCVPEPNHTSLSISKIFYLIIITVRYTHSVAAVPAFPMWEEELETKQTWTRTHGWKTYNKIPESSVKIRNPSFTLIL